MLPEKNRDGGPFTLNDFLEEIAHQSIVFSPPVAKDVSLFMALQHKANVQEVREVVSRLESLDLLYATRRNDEPAASRELVICSYCNKAGH